MGDAGIVGSAALMRRVWLIASLTFFTSSRSLKNEICRSSFDSANLLPTLRSPASFVAFISSFFTSMPRSGSPLFIASCARFTVATTSSAVFSAFRAVSIILRAFSVYSTASFTTAISLPPNGKSESAVFT